MSINGVNFLFSWICGEDEAEYEALKEQAASGNEEVKIELAALNVEKAENVNENMTFLEQHAQKDSVAANLYLGTIFSEGIATNDDSQNQVVIAQDWKKSNFYLEKAIELGSLRAYLVRGLHAFFHCYVFYNRDEEDESEMIMNPPEAQDYLDGEKYLLQFISLKDDKTLNEDEKAFVYENLKLVASWLSCLYKCENPVSPIMNQEKSLEWQKKMEEFNEYE